MKRLFIISLLSIILFWNFKLNVKRINENQEYKNTRFVTAESGLLCREKPHGKVIHKFAYGTEVEIIERTDKELTIKDNGKKISGHWVKVRIGNTNTFGYVFDGFLAINTHFDLDVEKIAALAPANFSEISNKKGLLLKGIHNIYDNDLNVIQQIRVNSISEIKILSVTRFERPRTRGEAKREKWQDYCGWANYVKIIYKNRELIIFGKHVLSIIDTTSHIFKNKEISLVKAHDYLKKSYTLTEELSDCYSGSFILIKSENNTYSFIKHHKNKSRLSFGDDESGYGGKEAIFKKDTIYFKNIGYSFQTGSGKYKLKIFKSHQWNFILYDDVKKYLDR